MKRSNEHGLGRGLGALIPRATVGLREVPVDAIRPNPWQPRTHFDEQELEELAQSIREHGVLQPVLVSQQQDGSFQLITGERRWRAVQLAGLATVPASWTARQDRKSTRLNSSHEWISYAVFCLKKKNARGDSGSHQRRTSSASHKRLA